MLVLHLLQEQGDPLLNTLCNKGPVAKNRSKLSFLKNCCLFWIKTCFLRKLGEMYSIHIFLWNVIKFLFKSKKSNLEG
jgi:hypothetical protein